MILNESVKTSVHSYNKSLDLFKKLRNLWDNLEDASDYEYMEALDLVDSLDKHVNKIDLADIQEYLKQKGQEKELESIKHNIKIFKEGSYTIGKEILGASYYKDLLDSVPLFITQLKKKYPLKYKGEKSDLANKFVSLITNPINIERYKNNIESIIRGNMTLPYFSRIYDSLIDESKTPKKRSSDDSPKFVETPPQMFTGDSKSEWEESLKQRKKELAKIRRANKKKAGTKGEKPEEFTKANKNFIRTPEGKEIQYDFEFKNKDGSITYYLNDEEVYSYLSESFISFSEYKKLI